MNSIELGNIVRFHRKKGGLTQQQLASLAGIGKTAVFDLEKGKESVQLDTVMKILGVLNIRLQAESPLMKEFSDRKEGRDEES